MLITEDQLKKSQDRTASKPVKPWLHSLVTDKLQPMGAMENLKHFSHCSIML